MKKLKWGILGTAAIAREQMIPAIRESDSGQVTGIASRLSEKARQTALEFGIPKFYGGYEEMLDDADIEAVYIPLPNHMHVEWAIRSLRAGKHVLVEKPVSLHEAQGRQLLEESRRHPQLKVMEAYMYRFHPQWKKVRELLAAGKIGNLKIIQASFSFYDDHPGSVYNVKDYGGGSIMDVGCYPVSVSRWLYAGEPVSVTASMEFHPEFDVDIHASGVMEFERGTTIFFSSIQLTEHQEVVLFGDKGKIRLELPFNPAADIPARIMIETETGPEIIETEICNQYAAQADAFSRSVLEDTEVPLPLCDSVNNMKVMDALSESGRSGRKIVLI